VFAAVGFFVRYMRREHAAVRYAADASYFCYLAHVPVLLYLQRGFREVGTPNPLRYPLLLFLTLAIVLLLYHMLVRYTFLARYLGGPGPRGRAAAAVDPAGALDTSVQPAAPPLSS